MFFLIPIIGTLVSGVGAAAGTVAAGAAAAGAAVAGTAAAAGSAVAAGAATAAGVATSGAGLAVLGSTATAYGAVKVIHDGEVENARREGYQNGLRQGNIDTTKKFEQRFKEFLEKSDANKIATWALGVHVANLDGIEDEELSVIYKKIGDPNSNLVSPYLRNQYMAIYEKCPRFGEVKTKYLNMVEAEFLVELNEYVNQIILSDQVISPEEKDFLEYEWYPYLQSRGIGVGVPSQSVTRSSRSSSYDSRNNEYSNYDTSMIKFETVALSRVSNKDAEKKNQEGISYARGTDGRPKDIEMAIECFKMAADMGSETAITNLQKLGYHI